MTSTIKVNNIQNQCGANIINESSNTITIGASGDTVTLASGASQTGFGRTGTVDWQTSSIKTATFTAVSGEGYFCNTTAGAFEVDLPAGSAGAIVALKDYAGTWDTNNLQVDPNGSEKIGGGVAGETAILSTEGGSVTLVYVDGTQGWVVVNDATQAVVGEAAAYVSASGGTTATVGDYKIHTFTGPGSFLVSNAGNAKGNNKIDYLVVGGGAGGAGAHGSAGGAGGFRESVPSPAAWTASPLANPGGALTAVAQSYTITVGAGGAGQCCAGEVPAVKGNASTFDSIQSAGGGGTGRYNAPGPVVAPTKDGGSGAGVNGTQNGPEVGLGNTPPVSPPQGNDGGRGSNTGPYYSGGGGGGATTAGNTGGPTTGAPGGTGATTSINNTPTVYAGGGGGGVHNTPPSNAGTGGPGGGGAGGGSGPGTAGTANTGGGGGGGGAPPSSPGGNGGSGIVILRYKFQN